MSSTAAGETKPVGRMGEKVKDGRNIISSAKKKAELLNHHVHCGKTHFHSRSERREMI